VIYSSLGIGGKARKKETTGVGNIKMDLRETGWDGMDWIAVAQDRNQWMAIVNMIMTFGFHKILGNS
jgi:hypothetical protein